VGRDSILKPPSNGRCLQPALAEDFIAAAELKDAAV
jgi:hypothetical protein